MLDCPRCDPSSVFGADRLRRLSLARGHSATLAEPIGGPHQVASDGRHVYLAFAAGDAAPAHGLVRIPARGVPREVLVNDGTSVDSFAFDSKRLYWSADGEVRAMPKPRGRSVTLAEGQYARGLAVDATHVYWIAPGEPGRPDAVRCVAKAGGSVESLATFPAIQGLVLDDRHVHCTFPADDESSYELVALSKTGGQPTVLVKGLPDGSGLLHAGGNGIVYAGGGALYRVTETNDHRWPSRP